MKTVDAIGYLRHEVGAKDAKKLRSESMVPCVLYGRKDETIHFSVPMILFRHFAYTPDAVFVNMDIEGDEYLCIMKDIQFHPVSETILHADFLRLYDDLPVTMDIPVGFTGVSVGVQKGGKLVVKLRKVKVKGLPQNMPDKILVSLDGLDLGQSVKVGTVKQENFTIISNPNVTVASVAIPRSLRSAQTTETKATGKKK
jgi:large subunit ribosomal protein L25